MRTTTQPNAPFVTSAQALKRMTCKVVRSTGVLRDVVLICSVFVGYAYGSSLLIAAHVRWA